MKLRLPPVPVALLGLFLLVAACGDDPSSPENEVYRAETVQVSGSVHALPAVLFDDPVSYGDGDGASENARLEVRRATLILRRDGRYEFSGDYRAELSESGPFPLGSFEDGTYTRSGNTITFDAASSSAVSMDRYLDDTGTIGGGVLTVRIADPLFEDIGTGDVYTFRP